MLVTFKGFKEPIDPKTVVLEAKNAGKEEYTVYFCNGLDDSFFKKDRLYSVIIVDIFGCQIWIFMSIERRVFYCGDVNIRNTAILEQAIRLGFKELGLDTSHLKVQANL